MTDWSLLVALGLAPGVGAFVQSSIGFGMAVVAAPAIVLLAPDLMPGALLVTTFALPLWQLLAGPRDVGWRVLGWALAARALLTPVGVVMVATFSPSAITATVGLLILLTVLASVSRLQVRPTTGAAIMAGAVAGVSGTAAAIGGPYLALVLQHESPVRLRSTLAAFFVAGSVLATTGLWTGGQFTARQVLAGALWLPWVALGTWASGPARRYLDAGRLRVAVLAFCAVAGVVLIGRAWAG